MSVYKRGDVWWYKFRFAGREIRESAKTSSKTVAREAEKQRHRELETGYNNLSDKREERIRTIRQISANYFEEYRLKHLRSSVFADYALRHVNEHLGETMVVDVDEQVIRSYQISRLKEKASPKTINEEVGFLLRALGEQGDALRIRMRRSKSLTLKVHNQIGKAYSRDQKEALLAAARVNTGSFSDDASGKPAGGTRSPFILPATALAFNAGMRNAEIRTLTWGQIDFETRVLTVGKSKTAAGEGRTIPMNEVLVSALIQHAKWYTTKFGTTKPGLYIFPARVGRPESKAKRPFDPTKPVTTLKTSWKNIKKRAGVTGRFHDARHTLITELCEAGAGDQTIMEIAGHVSPQMLKRYSHIRMAAKRAALDSIPQKSKERSIPAVDAEPKEQSETIQ